MEVRRILGFLTLPKGFGSGHDSTYFGGPGINHASSELGWHGSKLRHLPTWNSTVAKPAHMASLLF